MSFEIQPATIEDAPVLAVVQREAFAEDAIVGYLFKDVPGDVSVEHDVKWMSSFFKESEIQTVRVSKVVDMSSREIVGFAKWDVPHPMTAEQKTERANGSKPKDPLPTGANVPLCEDFFGQLDRITRQWIDPEKDTYLHILAIRPRFHRLGLGTSLIKHGLNVADAAGSKVYIIASPMGLPLYLRHGWNRVDEVAVDMRKYGGSSIVAEELLFREIGAIP